MTADMMGAAEGTTGETGDADRGEADTAMGEADTAEGGAVGGPGVAGPAGVARPAAEGRWAVGEQILWRYRDNADRRQFHICRPMTVVRDTEELLAVWMAPGTPCIRPVLADGTPVHREPLSTRYTKPRRTTLDRWFGAGVLKLARPGDPWSVWLFWERGWQFKNWYVNLEEPRRRWAGGIDSEDHFLDICVYPDRRWEWRDEDEFAQAQRDGLISPAQAAEVRSAGRAAIAQITAWRSPFADGWENWRPDPAWGIPRLPEGWDRAPDRLLS